MNLLGQIINAWTVIAGPETVGRHPQWECRCRCGAIKLVFETSLRSGKSQSCGCLHREKVNEALLAARLSHRHTRSMTYTSEYAAWQSMRARCCNPSRVDYPRYGGRGIKVCTQWRDSFERFLADMGPKPSTKHQIDRYPNNDGNYEPGNCRWATPIQQARNRRSSKVVVGFGGELPLIEFCEVIGAHYKTVRQRMDRGSTFEKAVLTPRSAAWAAKYGRDVYDRARLGDFKAKSAAKRAQKKLDFRTAA
ncbi:hypothetical protein [Mesorhizobium amorphae]|uniref:hypothetical protein n=1 Tax=Mesorhizobium amorphae TaxID=71433 RepID=UPI0011852F72|nr:hypothetical protein [Mesorhizobium amorphae]